MLEKIEIILNKENPRYPAIDADQIHIPFRGNAGLRISSYDFGYKAKMKFLDTGGKRSIDHDLHKGLNYPSMIWGVQEETYDWLYFELDNSSECNGDVDFYLEILPPREGKVVAFHYSI